MQLLFIASETVLATAQMHGPFLSSFDAKFDFDRFSGDDGGQTVGLLLVYALMHVLLIAPIHAQLVLVVLVESIASCTHSVPHQLDVGLFVVLDFWVHGLSYLRISKRKVGCMRLLVFVESTHQVS